MFYSIYWCSSFYEYKEALYILLSLPGFFEMNFRQLYISFYLFAGFPILYKYITALYFFISLLVSLELDEFKTNTLRFCQTIGVPIEKFIFKINVIQQ